MNGRPQGIASQAASASHRSPAGYSDAKTSDRPQADGLRRRTRGAFVVLVASAICLFPALGVGLCGCTQSQSASSDAGAASSTAGNAGAQSASGTAATQVVTDSMGRQVAVPVDPERVAALDSFTGEAMVMGKADSQMVAAPGGVKSDAILQQIYPGLANVSSPMSGGTVNIESLMTTGAQVAIIKSSLYYSSGVTDSLDKAGIPYVVIAYDTMEEQAQALEIIGQVCGGQVQSNLTAMAAYYRETIARVQEHAAQIPESEKVRVYHAINEVVRTDGATSLGTDWIQCVGGIDVSAGQELGVGETDYNTTLEQVFVWDPDVVICNAASTTDYLYTDSKWTSLRAVREKTVYSIPVGATRWGQPGSVETFFAMLWLGKTIYPDYYADIDLQSEVTSFYRTYLGIDIDDTTYQQMLSGVGIRKTSDNAGTTNGGAN